MTISKRNNVKNILNSIEPFQANVRGLDINKQGTQPKLKSKESEKVEETCENCAQECCTKYFSQMMLNKRFPFLKWLPTYNFSYLVRDFIAGISVGLTAIPQGIAYAIVAGLEPQYGLYSTIMPCFLYIFFGSCKDMTLGPTAIMSLMTYPYASVYGSTYAILLCFLSGIIILLLSFFQLGFLVDFISLPVTTGFTAAAAVTIGSAQIKNFLGLKISANSVVYGWLSVLKNLDKIRWSDTALGCGTILVLLLTRHIKSKSSSFNGETATKKTISNLMWLIGLSGNAIVVICGSILAYILAQDNVSPFLLTGKVSSGLPPFEVPSFSTGNTTFVDSVTNLGSAIIAIPLISILETIAIAKAFEKGKGIDATQEMIAVGLANLAGSFISSMPVSGSFTRTAINNSSSVKTPLGGLFTGLLVLLALSYLTKLFYYIPKATLAGLIITAMIFMIEYHTVVVLWRTKKSDLVPFCFSFFSCLFFGVEIGIVVGIATNLCIILHGIARPSIKISWLNINNQNILYVVPKQNLLFPAAAHLREIIIEDCKRRNDYSPIVINGTHVYNIDSTTAKVIESLMEDLKARGQLLYLWKWNESPIRTCIGYNEKLKWHLRHQDSLEQLLNESIVPCNEDESSDKEFSNNASNEQLTNVSNNV